MNVGFPISLGGIEDLTSTGVEYVQYSMQLVSLAHIELIQIVMGGEKKKKRNTELNLDKASTQSSISVVLIFLSTNVS